ncbi:MAG: hypothetical protein R3320_02685 [Nitriliruptorales bacterium]|nr:hypothetical protein [Nitriliruptorales bacterium]
MFMDAEDARSDFVLAAATTLFGGVVAALIISLPLYPDRGVVGQILNLLWIFVLTGLVPYLLVRYRDMGLRGFGLDHDRGAMVPGLLVALPVVVLGVVRALGVGDDNGGFDAPLEGNGVSIFTALLGRLSGAAFGDPTVGPQPSAADALVDLIFRVAAVSILWVGIVLLFTFLTTRARDAFRRTELPLVEGLRTFGIATAGIALLFGLLAAIRPGVTLISALFNIGTLIAMILLVDRLVTKRMTTSRATLLAPALIALLVHVIGGSDLLFNLYAGVLAAGAAIVLGALVETRNHAWAVVPVAAAMALYPTCISPLAIGTVPGC